MYTLVFDTTGAACSIALLNNAQALELFHEEMDFGQAEVLIAQIQHILDKHKLNFANLDLIGVCTGPGSFTGVRSSIAAARAFALAYPNMNITGISAFEAYANSLEFNELSSVNAVIIETKRDDFYVQLFNGRLEKISPESALSYGQIIDLLKGKTVTLIGNGVERFLDKPSGLVLHAIRMDKNVSINNLALCAIQKFNHKKLQFPKPLYLRAPDVCVKS